MEKETYIGILKDMLKIYSPSGREEKLGVFLKGELEKLGFDKVWTDIAGNVYGEIGFGSPTVLLCGHMDTVLGWIPVKMEDGQLHGRGAVDAKASLAAMVSAASSFRSCKGKGRVVLAGVVEEEHTAKGIRQLLLEDLKADYAVFGEPSGVKNITFAYKGKLGLRITCKTKSGHVGAQHLLDNAIETSFELWKGVKIYCARHKSPHGLFYSLTPCLADISSQKTSGGIPDVGVLYIDLRLPPKVRPEAGVELVEEIISDFRKTNPGVSVSLEVTDMVESFVAKRTTPVMKSLQKAILKVTGGAAKFLRKTGTGDMNIFGGGTGVPVATYGPGDARLSHTVCEYIDISEYLTSIRVYQSFLEVIMRQASN